MEEPSLPTTLQPTAGALPRTHRPREGAGGGYKQEQIPYSQHPQLLEPCKVILMDPGDVVAIEFPGGGKERRKW